MLVLEHRRYLGNNNLLFQHNSGISICEVAYTRKVSEDWHCHEHMHFTLFVKGGTIEKRKDRTTVQAAGDISFFRSFEPHLNYNTSPDSKNLNIEIGPSFLEQWKLTETGMESFMQNMARSKPLVLKLYSECLINDRFTDDTLGMLLTQCSPQPLFFKENQASPKWVYSLFELLNDCWNENPGIRDIAATLGIHPVTLSKHFPKFFGCTYGEYMRRLKTSHAIKLIQQKVNLTEIAFLCGFADQSHFIRTFKQLTGFLPGVYKKAFC